jgi:hypothetical protein
MSNGDYQPQPVYPDGWLGPEVAVATGDLVELFARYVGIDSATNGQ